MRLRFGVALVLSRVSVVCASAQMRRSELVNLIGDTDEAIRLARFVTDLFVLDPTARRAILHAREAVIQGWIEERTPDQLSEQERVIFAALPASPGK